jgi:hypothetical protein
MSIDGINEAHEAGWDRRTDPMPYARPMSGESMARKAGEEQPGAVYDLCDHLRALARRIEDEGVNSDTVDRIEALKNEAEGLLS